MSTFQDEIFEVIKKHITEVDPKKVVSNSYMLQYILIKTKSANSGSKSRSSFGNLYAIYVLVQDYLNQKSKGVDYSKYEGAKFSDLLESIRQLPFGNKMQNHALNNRMNDEFFKFFPTLKGVYPIVRDLVKKTYLFNLSYLIINVDGSDYDISEVIIEIINSYVKVKQSSLKKFVESCLTLQSLDEKNENDKIDFIKAQLSPNVDARLFELVSYSILKHYFKDVKISWGVLEENNLSDKKVSLLCIRRDEKITDNVALFKTGRTNANDGGIDFVMRPIGRFFQVTETLDFKKYFLDIEKIERYPITFVIKSELSKDQILNTLSSDAKEKYKNESIVNSYMKCIEDVINIPTLNEILNELQNDGTISDVLEEIIVQSKVEFNYDDVEEDPVEN